MGVAITIGAVVVAAACALVAWRTRRDAHQRSAARVAALAARIDPAPHGEGTMFAVRDGRGGPSLARLAAGAGTVLGVVLVAVLAGEVLTRAPAQAARPVEVPLALVALEHSGRPGHLVVSGQVQAQTPGPAAPLLVTVTAVGRTGETLGSRQAVVSQRPLAVGQAVPFAVSLAGIDGVDRYRIAFRDGTQVVRHVDRRTAAAR